MRGISSCVVVVALLACGGARAAQFTGEATAYRGVIQPSENGGGGYCGITELPTAARTYFAALNRAQFGSQGEDGCGRCARARCIDQRCRNNGWVTVLLVDRCYECAHGDIDFSNPAFLEMTGHAPHRLNIEWDFVPCPSHLLGGGGNVEFYLKDGINPYWVAVQPRNALQKVVSVTINGQPTTLLQGSYFYVWSFSGGAVPSTLTIRATAENGEVIEGYTAHIAEKTVIKTGQQFSL